MKAPLDMPVSASLSSVLVEVSVNAGVRGDEVKRPLGQLLLVFAVLPAAGIVWGKVRVGEKLEVVSQSHLARRR